MGDMIGKAKATIQTVKPDDGLWYMDKDTYAVTKDKPQSWRYESFTPSIDLVDGQTYHLVVVEYTTGNSFGRDPDTHFEVVDAYPTPEEAFKFANEIKRQDGVSQYQYHAKQEILQVNYADGRKYGYATWEGYFERLQRVVVKRFTAAETPDFVVI